MTNGDSGSPAPAPRILLIASAPYHPWKGTCHRIRHNLEAIAALGYEADFLTLDAGELSAMERVRVFRVPRAGCFSRLLLFLKAFALADRQRYELIHGMGDCGVVAYWAGRFSGTPFVFELHSDDVPQPMRSGRDAGDGIRRYSARRALARANAVIGNDMCVVSYLSGLNLHSRACLIPDIPAVEGDVAEPARNLARIRFRTSPEQKIITCVGSYSRFQGLDIFFNAMPQVMSAVPAAKFVVVGGDADEIKRMRGKLEAAGIEEAVMFPGRMHTDEMAALLAISDVLVSPRRGGCAVPIKVLDYLCSGSPIVAVDTPANRAILTPANALITRPAPDSLADGIIRLCMEPALGSGLAREGRATLRREKRCAGEFKDALRVCYDYAAGNAKL
jgi:glycosyltransferase involved in cell wall biosynthesis